MTEKKFSAESGRFRREMSDKASHARGYLPKWTFRKHAAVTWPTETSLLI